MEEAPVVLPFGSSGSDDAGLLKAALAELEIERQARTAAEKARSELQAAFTRLKTFTEEAVRQRDETVKHLENAERLNEELRNEAIDAYVQRDDAIRQKDDAIKARNAISMERDDVVAARDLARVEIESTTQLLVVGADIITAKTSSMKNFVRKQSQSLSSAHTGLAAIAYNYTKQIEIVVGELMQHLETYTEKEQSAYESALKVRELEASLQWLKDELSLKSMELDECQKLSTDNQTKIVESEQTAFCRISEVEKENKALRNALEASDCLIRVLKASLKDLADVILLANEVARNLSRSTNSFMRSHLTSTWPSYGDEMEEGFRNCLLRLKEIIEYFAQVALVWEEQTQLRNKKLESLEGAITRLIMEKKEITTFLESALANKQELLESISRSNGDNDKNLNTSRKNWDAKNGNLLPDSGPIKSLSGTIDQDSYFNEEYKAGQNVAVSLALLGNEATCLRQEVFELQQFLAVARGEGEWLRVTSDCQAKEIADKAVKIKDLEEKQAHDLEKVEGLKIELAAAEKEIFRWKHAAMEEAKAGAKWMEEVERCQEQITILEVQVRRLSIALEESNSKLSSKEEIEIAAIAARDAAERSLQISDQHTIQLRKRIEEMTRQFELLEGRGDERMATGPWDSCWPYQWLRRKSVSAVPRDGGLEELMEPFV